MWDQSNLALAALEIKDLQTSSRALMSEADSSEPVQSDIFSSLTRWKKLSCSRIVDKGVFALFTKGGNQFPGQQRCAAATTLIFQTSPCSYSVSAAGVLLWSQREESPQEAEPPSGAGTSQQCRGTWIIWKIQVEFTHPLVLVRRGPSFAWSIDGRRKKKK